MADPKITDLSYLHEITMGDDMLAIEMIVIFLQHAPASLNKLKSLVQKEEWSEVAAVSHRLKPNLAYMGLESAKEIMERVEKNAKARKGLENIENQIRQVEQACRKSYKELEEALNELRS